LDIAAFLKIPVVFKRKHISLKSGDDKYGHWWAELNSTESYGWWPDRYVGIWDTLTSVPGILNGQPPAPFGGTPTRDPHHGQSAEDEHQMFIKSHDQTISEALQAIRDFANSYSGTWSWPFGKNCHSFQTSMAGSTKLTYEKDIE
jgi:hypothetical protein